MAHWTAQERGPQAVQEPVSKPEQPAEHSGALLLHFAVPRDHAEVLGLTGAATHDALQVVGVVGPAVDPVAGLIPHAELAAVSDTQRDGTSLLQPRHHRGIRGGDHIPAVDQARRVGHPCGARVSRQREPSGPGGYRKQVPSEGTRSIWGLNVSAGKGGEDMGRGPRKGMLVPSRHPGEYVPEKQRQTHRAEKRPP